MDLRYSDGIAAARTMLAVEGNAAALQRRLPNGWELASYAGDDLRGRAPTCWSRSMRCTPSGPRRARRRPVCSS
jgi:hypothetical protein